MATSLTSEQAALAKQLEAKILDTCAAEVRQIAELLAGKPYAELLGKTEFEVRDLVHKIGAMAVQTALEERKKGGTEVRANRVPGAATPPSFNAGSRKRSSV